MGRIGVKLANQVASLAVKDLYLSQFKCEAEEAKKRALVLADRIIDDYCPNRKKIMEVASDFLTMTSCLYAFRCFYGADYDGVVPDDWFQLEKSPVWACFKMEVFWQEVNVTTPFPLKRRDNCFHVPNKFKSEWVKCFAPAITILEKAVGCYEEIVEAMMSAGTLSAVKKNLPNIVKYLPKDGSTEGVNFPKINRKLAGK